MYKKCLNWFKHGLNNWSVSTVFNPFKPKHEILDLIDNYQYNQGFSRFLSDLNRISFRIHNPEVSGSTPDLATIKPQ